MKVNTAKRLMDIALIVSIVAVIGGYTVMSVDTSENIDEPVPRDENNLLIVGDAERDYGHAPTLTPHLYVHTSDGNETYLAMPGTGGVGIDVVADGVRLCTIDVDPGCADRPDAREVIRKCIATIKTAETER